MPWSTAISDNRLMCDVLSAKRYCWRKTELGSHNTGFLSRPEVRSTTVETAPVT
jgi:hypothetical protein